MASSDCHSTNATRPRVAIVIINGNMRPPLPLLHAHLTRDDLSGIQTLTWSGSILNRDTEEDGEVKVKSEQERATKVS
jgi:hypothetical protein